MVHAFPAFENVALRLQLAAFKRKRKRPVLTQWDRLFWAGISRPWSGWRDALVFVQPDTVIRWQRERFRKFWARLSQTKRGRQGRPAIAAEIRRLILRMAAANPLWRVPRIHGEFKMLGIVISERTVSRILRTIHFAPTVSDLADVSAQSPRPDRVGRLLYRSDGPAADLVRVLGAGA